ncbi:Wzz/FepE/Etk N-terminal domain-containing protein, partial [Candidatus Marinimicrobia bacterium]|nr:Wzz/FepE/Etk N-terminal domain-containing protein [Candidatus Neomarinimicrobiota bacterium]
AKLSQIPPVDNPSIDNTQSPVTHYASSSIFEEDTILLSDILLTMAEQLKVIVLIPFITVFLTFTYVQFIQVPQYTSWATVLLPSGGGGNLGGLAGLASQFGVNVPTGAQADLSSPSLFPELLRSRTFGEKILDKKFYTIAFGKELSLLAILTHGNDPPKVGRDTLVTSALGALGGMLEFNLTPSGSFSVIKATANEPKFAKELAEVTLAELEALNRFYKSQTINEKTIFISNRIASVETDLEASEKALKEFNERNRQISSPALQLEQGRLARDVEIQKGIYLTLRQQYELAKIEEVQETSIVQVLDHPQVPLGPINKNLKGSVILSFILGMVLGIIFGFVRSYVNNSDVGERRKLRRVRSFLKKKTKDIILDRRISGIISVLLLIGLPFYLGHQSKVPVYFGMYSAKLMLFNLIYVIVMILSLGIFVSLSKKK